MIHYNEFPDWDINRGDYAHHQRMACGAIIINNRPGWKTKIFGVDCPGCLSYHKELISRPFDCEKCHKALDRTDIAELRCDDEQRLCKKCRHEK